MGSGLTADVETAVPRLAIVVSCYNYQDYVARAIESVTSQRSADCELVVVDDGSSDDSWSVICRSGVRAFKIPNSGQRAACVFGLDRTSAPFVLFLDADDELKPGSIATILAQLDANVAKLQFAMTRIDRYGNVIGDSFPKLKEFRDFEHVQDRILQSAVYTTPPTSGNVFRRDVCELLREVEYDDAVDGVILYAAPFLGDVVSLPDELCNYRVHDRNHSGSGRPINPSIIQRDMERFVSRTNHLRDVLQRLGRSDELVDPVNTFYYRERQMCLAVETGRRPHISEIAALLLRLWHEAIPPASKVMMMGFYGTVGLLPNSQARILLAHRFKTSSHSKMRLAGMILRSFFPRWVRPAAKTE